VSKEHLSTYLNDHLAGAHFAIEILDRLASETSDWTSSLATLRADIQEDRAQLQTLMARVDIAESSVRKASGWIAESLAEVKLKMDDERSGALRRLERLEALAIGIEGKIALWQGLAAAAASSNSLGWLDYERLDERGQDQRARVEVLRLEAARAALVI
jgi:hypothetical protein